MVGITTARDVGSSDFIDVGLRNAVRSGIIPGPRMLVAVHAIGATGGHCDDQGGFRFNVFGHESSLEDGVINGQEEARKAVRMNVKYGADVIKTCATGGVLSLNDAVDTPQLTQKNSTQSWMKRTRCARRPPRTLTVLKAPNARFALGIDSIEHAPSWMTKRWT